MKAKMKTNPVFTTLIHFFTLANISAAQSSGPSRDLYLESPCGPQGGQGAYHNRD